MMEDLKWHFKKNDCSKLQYSCLNAYYGCLTKIVANKASIPRFVDALAVFIKQKRAKVKRVKSMLNKPYKVDNSSWAGKYLIQIHGSIAI